MNAGGDPGQDDFGLPPVDIDVPDDARELARDVQAYRRELRSRRRQLLARRLYGPLTRDGMVLPVLAGCLALTLVAATLLTVFTARQPTVSLRPQRPATGTGQAAPIRVTDDHMTAALNQLLDTKNQLTRVLLGGQPAGALPGQAPPSQAPWPGSPGPARPPRPATP